jgi:hypothetical protein
LRRAEATNRKHKRRCEAEAGAEFGEGHRHRNVRERSLLVECYPLQEAIIAGPLHELSRLDPATSLRPLKFDSTAKSAKCRSAQQIEQGRRVHGVCRLMTNDCRDNLLVYGERSLHTRRVLGRGVSRETCSFAFQDDVARVFCRHNMGGRNSQCIQVPRIQVLRSGVS